MDCKVVLDSKKILVDRDELNFGANIFPMSLFEEDVSSYRFRKIDLKYLSDDIELLISKSSNTVYVLFEKSDFFDNHLLKSKILKRFKKKYVLTDDDFIVEHPTKVSLKKRSITGTR
ncbi:hypothetical protein [Acinetobacter johnsonii]|uniref:hypothetical protein n=1 Tax=Acinetobacter johnsonii TaxID=40214 RepID=UPI003AF62253